MKIEGTLKPVGTTTPGESRVRPRSDASSTAPSDDKVELSSLSTSLSKAEAALSATPAVDQSRVDEIRQAISEGRFKIDANRIADGLIESVRQMLDARS
ncbi:flagellar biosynthesis anti-sigma factor FlgM [Azoarcus sp. KH32C]|uniref:flagellar biosynthesis anti-sigma factor FlgM n=1 Tax=Azoarcus sp. KH32C TaxID=748247 RepID=UPI00023864BA|nr:flagellar biosynthesis anti-sigma factor FlgM [Azoarcus sp. KH32C]BAL23626.1 putative negative regulator of flagellin synthesis [Azoarcus sp. KH32C]